MRWALVILAALLLTGAALARSAVRRQPGQTARATRIVVAAASGPQPLLVEADTVGLWHFDEATAGAALVDASSVTSPMQAISMSPPPDGPLAVSGVISGGRELEGQIYGLYAGPVNAGAALASALRGDFTLEMWVKRTLGASGCALLQVANGDFSNPYLSVNATAVGSGSFIVGGTSSLTGGAYAADPFPVVGEWHHTAMTLHIVNPTTATIAVYGDGVPGAVRTDALQVSIGASPVVYIGIDNNGVPCDLAMDEMRISSTAHTPEKILADYHRVKGD